WTCLRLVTREWPSRKTEPAQPTLCEASAVGTVGTRKSAAPVAWLSALTRTDRPALGAGLLDAPALGADHPSPGPAEVPPHGAQPERDAQVHNRVHPLVE